MFAYFNGLWNRITDELGFFKGLSYRIMLFTANTLPCIFLAEIENCSVLIVVVGSNDASGSTIYSIMMKKYVIEIERKRKRGNVKNLKMEKKSVEKLENFYYFYRV